MSFRKYNFYQNQKQRTTLYSKGGTIEGDINFNGNWNIDGSFNYNINNLKLNGDLDMNKNEIVNVSDIRFRKNLQPLETINLEYFINDEDNPRAKIWYQNSDLSNGFPELLRLGSGDNTTSWSIALRDPSGSNNPVTDPGRDVNQLSYGYNGYEPTSILAINYDDISHNSVSIKNLLRLQTGGASSTTLFYTIDGKLSVGNSETDLSNNGGYRLDINGNGFLRGNTLKIGTSRTITNSTDNGEIGEICWGNDSGTDYIYVCVNNNSWKRVSLSTW